MLIGDKTLAVRNSAWPKEKGNVLHASSVIEAASRWALARGPGCERVQMANCCALSLKGAGRMIANVLSMRAAEDILLNERESTVTPLAGFLQKKGGPALCEADPSTKRDLGRI
jgi:hypothetical protein